MEQVAEVNYVAALFDGNLEPLKKEIERVLHTCDSNDFDGMSGINEAGFKVLIIALLQRYNSVNGSMVTIHSELPVEKQTYEVSNCGYADIVLQRDKQLVIMELKFLSIAYLVVKCPYTRDGLRARLKCFKSLKKDEQQNARFQVPDHEHKLRSLLVALKINDFGTFTDKRAADFISVSPKVMLQIAENQLSNYQIPSTIQHDKLIKFAVVGTPDTILYSNLNT